MEIRDSTWWLLAIAIFVCVWLVAHIIVSCRWHKPIKITTPPAPAPPKTTIDFVKLNILPKRISEIADDAMREVIRSNYDCVHVTIQTREENRIIRIDINVDPL